MKTFILIDAPRRIINLDHVVAVEFGEKQSVTFVSLAARVWISAERLRRNSLTECANSPAN